MLPTEPDIEQGLELVVVAIRDGNREAALEVFELLDFERFRDAGQEKVQITNTSDILKRERIWETGNHIVSCWAALLRGDDAGARVMPKRHLRGGRGYESEGTGLLMDGRDAKSLCGGPTEIIRT